MTISKPTVAVQERGEFGCSGENKKDNQNDENERTKNNIQNCQIVKQEKMPMKVKPEQPEQPEQGHKEEEEGTKQSKGESTVETGSIQEEEGTSPNTSISLDDEDLLRNAENKGQRNLRRSLSKQLSQNLAPVKPETPLGWVTFLSTFASAVFAYECRLQKRLTCPPSVYTQSDNKYMDLLRKMLPNSSKDGLSILTRNIKPSLIVGTRAVLSSSASYAVPHFSNTKEKETFVRFREIMTMEADGAKIALDWEIPLDKYASSVQTRKVKEQYVENVQNGPIQRPVVVILHGLNNDASFGYMRSLMKSCTDHGWIACGFNFRGCGNVQCETPRSYNIGYTGDLRCLIQKVQARLIDPDNTPVFLVGNSLGANIITKYLGEEGYSNTLPKCVKGGLSLGNPLHIHGQNIHFPLNVLLNTGVKKILIKNWTAFHNMTKCIHFKKAIKNLLLSKTIGEFDDIISPYMVRNDPQYPFNTKIGFQNGEDYWHDSSSRRYIQHVSVPLMILSSQDDFLIGDSSLRSIGQCLCNPFVLVVKTKCGGHLGWYEAPPSGNFGIGKSWADTAMSDFFTSVMKTDDLLKKEGHNVEEAPPVGKIVESMYASTQLTSKL